MKQISLKLTLLFGIGHLFLILGRIFSETFQIFVLFSLLVQIVCPLDNSLLAELVSTIPLLIRILHLGDQNE